MEHKARTIIIAGLLILVVALVAGYMHYYSAPINEGVLYIETGTVEVDSGNGYTAAENEMTISEGDKIRTNNKSSATLHLYESVMVNIDESSEIEVTTLIDENVEITQLSGSTWNQFSNVFGVQTFTLTTNDASATVEGTQFGASEEGILVGDGTVGVTYDGQFYQIEEGNLIWFGETGAILNTFGDDEKAYVLARMRNVLEKMKTLRNYEIEKQLIKYGPAVDPMIRNKFTREDLERTVDEIDAGMHDVDEIVKEAPVMTDQLMKIAEMTKAIQKEQAAIKTYENS